MNINRNNYEEFFLMYVDNELSAAERKNVQGFLLQNPDLKHELELLQQSIIEPDKTIFDNKILLLKDEWLNIEMQKELLLLLDNELSIGEKEKITRLIENNNTVANEWNLLQQTKMHADESILFENKPSLYKTSRGRVIDFDWRKIAVAAALITFILWGSVSFFAKKDIGRASAVALKNNTNNTSAVNIQEIKQAANNHPLLKDTSNKLRQEILVQQIIKKPVLKIEKQSVQQKNIVVFNKNDKKPIINNLSQQNFNSDSSNNTETANVSIKRLIDKVSNRQNDMALNNEKPTDELIDNNKNEYAATTSLNDNADNNPDDNHILYIPEKKLQKTKIGGLFTKIKNAGKKGIHIANIEIAIK